MGDEEVYEKVRRVAIEFASDLNLNLKINQTLYYTDVVEFYMVDGFFYMRFYDGCETYINTKDIKNILIDANKPEEENDTEEAGETNE